MTLGLRFDCIAAVKSLALGTILFLQCACTTLVTRRDFYSPEPAPDSLERLKEMAGTVATVTTTSTRTQIEEKPAAGPDFRY